MEVLSHRVGVANIGTLLLSPQPPGPPWVTPRTGGKLTTSVPEALVTSEGGASWTLSLKRSPKVSEALSSRVTAASVTATPPVVASPGDWPAECT